MNKNALIKKIKELEGLTNDEKSALLELLRTQKKYGLVWENKPEDVEQQLEEELPILTEVKERAIISDDPSAPNHLLIEGDNLHALTALTYTHEGKIDVIYIDPPYNTGKKDEFKYNDEWIEKDNPYKHTKWCSYINKRLKLAQRLLTSNGIIFISIDDHEFSQLKCICDSIFLENNFINNFIWYTDGHTDNQDVFTNVHEYILCYALNKGNAKPNSIVDPNIPDDSKIQRDFAENSIIKNGFKNPPSRITLPKGFPCEVEQLELQQSNDIDLFMEEVRQNSFISRDITKKFNMSYPVRINPMVVTDYKLSKECEVFSGWMNPEKLKEFIKNEYVPLNEHKTNTTLRFFLSKNGVVYYRREGRTSHYVQTILENMGTTEQNKYMLERMGVSFEYPKPVELIIYLLSLFSKNNSIILDFFAGSGTTLHATMKLNSEDGGHRQCILVTNKENNICEEVTYVRNKRVIQGYTTPKGEEVEGLTENTLRYYRTDFVPREQTNKNKRALLAAATDLLCIKNNVYAEQSTFGGRKLKPSAARYFDDGKTRMLVIYNELAVDTFASMLRDIELDGMVLVYVFSNNRYAYNDNFEEVLDKVVLCALPAAIYDAYKKVLKPKKAKEETVQEQLVDEIKEWNMQGEINFSEEGGEE